MPNKNRDKGVVIIIYTLTDPRTGLIRYVGQTSVSLGERLQQHLYDARKPRNHKTFWLRQVVDSGTIPQIEELDRVSINDLATAESYWIQQMNAWGMPLTNSTAGGEGAPGRKVSIETRAKMSASSKKGSIYQYSLSGELIKEWESTIDAARGVGVDATKIISVCAGRRFQTGGFIWSRNIKPVSTYHRSHEYPLTTTIGGIKLTIAEIAEMTTLSRAAIHRRIHNRNRCDDCFLNPTKAPCKHNYGKQS